MIARSPTGAALLVHLRAEVMHRSYPILGDTLRRIEYLTTHTSIADLATLFFKTKASRRSWCMRRTSSTRDRARLSPSLAPSSSSAIMPFRDLAIAAEIADVAEKRLPKSIHLKRLLTKAALAAHHADQFRFAQNLSDSEESFTRALLHTIDELTLALHAPDLYAQIQASVLSRGTSYEAAHTHVTELNLSQVIKVFSEVNGLPTSFSPSHWTGINRTRGRRNSVSMARSTWQMHLPRTA
jgi:hypothetical protein